MKKNPTPTELQEAAQALINLFNLRLANTDQSLDTGEIDSLQNVRLLNDKLFQRQALQVDGNFFASGDRLKTIFNQVYESFDAVTSLQAAGPLFPGSTGTGPGEMDVHVVVEAFSNFIEKRLGVLLTILNGEDGASPAVGAAAREGCK